MNHDNYDMELLKCLRRIARGIEVIADKLTEDDDNKEVENEQPTEV